MHIGEFIEQSEQLLKARSNISWVKLVNCFAAHYGETMRKRDVNSYILNKRISVSKSLKLLLKSKPIRTLSGVAPVTIFTKPYKCSGKCIFCPTQDNIPKSYLKNEPGVQRAVAQDFNPYKQIKKRIEALKINGHDVSKVEVIISGGTWDDYSELYRYNFITNVFLALNDAEEEKVKHIDWKYLQNVQKNNSRCALRCVGMSIETRPDKINIQAIALYRRMGITKVQIGIQSLDDEILEQNNRGHTVSQTREAIKLLRANGFKIQLHWMCNLYGSDIDKDYDDFKKLFSDEDIRPDELKIYPCSIVDGTVLYKYYKDGAYRPYSTDELIELLSKCKKAVQPYCRISRLFRDIPSDDIVAGNRKTNLRQMIDAYMSKNGTVCNCIRCREIRSVSTSIEKCKICVFEYDTTVSKEYFLSYETEEGKLAAFLRLAIYKKNAGKLQLVPVDAMIREVHVYGGVVDVGHKNTKYTQHSGMGSCLIEKAVELSKSSQCTSIAVISAVGTREYYSARDFVFDNDFGYGVRQI